MKPSLVKYAVVPALVLLPVTVARAWLELNHPEWTLTKLVSVNAVTGVLVIDYIVLFLLNNVAFKRFVAIVATMLLGIRLPIGIAYGLAMAQHWTVAGTDDPVRYLQGFKAGTNAMLPFLGAFLAASVGILLISIVVWIELWAVAFRGRRPLFSDPAVAPAASAPAPSPRA